MKVQKCLICGAISSRSGVYFKVSSGSTLTYTGIINPRLELHIIVAHSLTVEDFKKLKDKIVTVEV